MPTEKTKTSCTLAAAALLLLSSRAVAAPSSVERLADVHFRQGVAAFQAHDLGRALEEFREAQKLLPHPVTLTNLARVLEDLGEVGPAFQLLADGLQDGSLDWTAERIDRAVEAMAHLRPRVGTVTLLLLAGTHVESEGAALTNPDHPLFFNPGAHVLRATKEGYLPATVQIEISAGEQQAVDLRLRPRVDAFVTATREEKQHSPLLVAGWITTGILASTAVATGVAALNTGSDLSRALDTYGTSPATLQHLDDRAQTLAVVTDVLLVSSIALGGLSLYAYFVEPKTRRGSARSLLVGRF